MTPWLNNPAFGIALSVACYQFGVFLNKRTRLAFFNPLLISVVLIILFLLMTGIPYDDFSKGGNIINFMLGPTTVALALPLYLHWKDIKRFIIPILIGIIAGCLASLTGVLLLGKIFGINSLLIHSMAPKSITTPIGVALSQSLGGNPSITVAAIIFTGILGAIIAPSVMRIFRIKSNIAKGIAMGTAAHAVGTSKAIEMGKTEGAMSSAAIGLSGLITVIIVPFLLPLFERFL